MENLVAVLLLVFLALPTHGKLHKGWSQLQIDCGATKDTLNELNITKWELDDEFIRTGRTNLVSMQQSPPQMNTLRYFPFGDKSCYRFRIDRLDTDYIKYQLRAGFYYGNYDGILNPPSFDLELDGTLWATVVTSLSEEPIFHEVVYTPKTDSVEVCLIRRSRLGGGVPFISSLEATFLPSGFYPVMNDSKKTAFYLQKRTRFGSDEQVGGLDRPDEEEYNRIWKPEDTFDYINLVPLGYQKGASYGENSPPFSVISYAIQAPSLSSSISMTVNFPPRSPLSAFFVLYFYDVSQPRVTGNRRILVYIDGHEKGYADVSKVSNPDESYGKARVVSVYPVTVVGPAKVTISPAENTTLPVILNAMEVFTQISKDGRNCLSLLFLLGFPFLSVLVVPFW